jgi:putative heme-binding domain-containing protein
MPKTAAGEALPPVDELIEQSGSVKRGKAVYNRTCMACHQVNGRGIDFGPDLSSIGDKFPKSQLYTAILEPSAGITHGYQGYRITLDNDNVWLGYIASETDEALSLRVQGGITKKLDKDNIAKREKLDRSLMTPNLQRTMSEQDLVDLVTYLETLKAESN